MKYIVSVIVGIIIGAVIMRSGGSIVGGVLGFIIIRLLELNEKVVDLEKRLALNSLQEKKLSDKSQQHEPPPEAKKQSIHEAKAESDKVESETSPAMSASEEKPDALEAIAMTSMAKEAIESEKIVIPAIEPSAEKAAVEEESTPPPQSIKHTDYPSRELPKLPDFIATAFDKIKSLVVSYFTGGNTLVRTGMLVLFVGIAFLLKYVADRTVIPIELRYVGISIGSLVLLVLGWRLRNRRAGFAVSLLGGGVGILYLTLFAAMRIHNLLPPHVVMMLLVVIVLLSATLAIFTDSMALAIIGVIGGFAAPVLTSTGSGSHVQLFSYYLLLNIGIFAIAWFKSWRLLNVVGFVATFGVSSVWGFKYYKPEFLSTVEPFLVVHFLLYTFIAILFAIKQPPKLKGITDGTIIFGTPIVAFSLQAALMKNIEYGLAYSALVVGIFYILTGFFIKRFKQPFMKDLLESFIALGIGFATLAIPLGFDGRVTSAMWVAEASALLWVGVRQSRAFPRFSGYVLSVLGMMAFFAETPVSYDLTAWLNANYVGSLIIFAATLFMGLYARKHHSRLFSFEAAWVPKLMVITAIGWWLFGGFKEINSHYPMNNFILLELFLIATIVALLSFEKKIKYSLFSLSSLVVAGLMLLVVLYIPAVNSQHNLLLNDRFLGLLVLALSHLCLSWYWQSEKRHGLSARFNQALPVFIFTGLVSWLAAFIPELQLYFPLYKFLLIEWFLVISAVLLLVAEKKLKVLEYAFASVPLVFGMILAIAMIPALSEANIAMLNIPFAGLSTIVLSHYVMSWYWLKLQTQLTSHKIISNSLLVVALAGWFLTGLIEISIYQHAPYLLNSIIVFVGGSFLAKILLAHKLNWAILHNIKFAFLPFLIFMMLVISMPDFSFHDGYGLFVWLFAAVINYWILRVYEGKEFRMASFYHVISLFLFSYIAVIELSEFASLYSSEGSIWQLASYSSMLLIISAAVFLFRNSTSWPLSIHREAYMNIAHPVIVIVLWLMVLQLNLSPPGLAGDFSYIPVLNLIDVVSVLTLLLVWVILKGNIKFFFVEFPTIVYSLIAVTAFIILNATLLRSFHYWYQIEYNLPAMWSSFLVQSSLSILWALTAVGLMVLSTRKQWRIVWLVGLGLIILVVVKLFLVDMSASGSIERIVAFLTVGTLLSLVGYFSPLPPEITSNSEAMDLKEESQK